MIYFILFFYLLSLASGDVNLEFQVDGDTSNSSVEVEVKYEPGTLADSSVPVESQLASSVVSPSRSEVDTSASARLHSTIQAMISSPSHHSPISPTPTSSPTKSSSVPQTHLVQVGARGETIFLPNRVDAVVGDVLKFQFLALNHTLTQSSLEDPCMAMGSFDTDFVHFNPSNRSDDSLMYLVQNTDPQWFFCRQNIPLSHCSAGMVFALNPGSKMETFLENARLLPSPSTGAITANALTVTTYSAASDLSGDPSTQQMTGTASSSNNQPSSEAISAVTETVPPSLMGIWTSHSSGQAAIPTPAANSPISSSGSLNFSIPSSSPTPPLAPSVLSRDENVAPSPFTSKATLQKNPIRGWHIITILGIIAARRLMEYFLWA